jgi:hypothetical protein
MFEKNVFQIWREHGEVVPFKVRRWSWSYPTYAVVTEVIVTEKNLAYYADTGKLYGKVKGFLVKDGRRADYGQCLSCAGCYQWEYVPVKGEAVKAVKHE